MLASGRKGDDNALPIRADARVLGATVKAGEAVTYALEPGRHAYLGLAKGAAEVNGAAVKARDGAAIRNVETITVTASDDAEIVLVDTR